MKSWKKIGLGLFLALLFPYAVTLFLSGQVKKPETELSYSGKQVILEGEAVDEEQFLIYVLAGQIPVEYETEALKAQAVLCRTALCKGLREGAKKAEETGLSYWTLQQMKEAWQEDFSENYEKLEEAVAQTACQTLWWEGDYIEAAWHRASAGKTRPGDTEHPYLISVESDDVAMENYLVIRSFSNEELARALNRARGTKTYEASGLNRTIQIENRDQAGYIQTLQIGGTSLTGWEFAEALSLPSESFTLEQKEDGLKFVCTGAGRGYGLSQWGAHRMAGEGKTYEDILNYYFRETEIRSDL